jgi:hypothetical protein
LIQSCSKEKKRSWVHLLGSLQLMKNNCFRTKWMSTCNKIVRELPKALLSSLWSLMGELTYHLLCW